MTFKVIKNNIEKINTNTSFFNGLIKALSIEIMQDIQSRFGKAGVKTASGGTVKGNSRLTANVKGKNTPLVGRTGKGRKLAIDKSKTGTYMIGVTQSYMIKVLQGGMIVAKGKGLIIPANKKAGRLLRKYLVINGGSGSGLTRLILENEANLFIPPGKNIMVKKLGRRTDIMFIFKKSITLPNRDVLYFSKANESFIKNGIIDYLESGRRS